MHTWNPDRLAAAFRAAEDTGLSKSDIGRIADAHRSQVSRWARGEQRPTYERTMRIAGYLKHKHPELAAEFVAAAGYGPVEDVPAIPGDVLRAIRKHYTPEQQAQVIEMLDSIAKGEDGETGHSEGPGDAALAG